MIKESDLTDGYYWVDFDNNKEIHFYNSEFKIFHSPIWVNIEYSDYIEVIERVSEPQSKADTSEASLNIKHVSSLLPPHPWNLLEVIKQLAEAGELLLNRYNYDGGKWEEILQCTKRSKEIIEFIEGNNS